MDSLEFLAARTIVHSMLRKLGQTDEWNLRSNWTSIQRLTRQDVVICMFLCVSSFSERLCREWSNLMWDDVVPWSADATPDPSQNSVCFAEGNEHCLGVLAASFQLFPSSKLQDRTTQMCRPSAWGIDEPDTWSWQWPRKDPRLNSQRRSQRRDPISFTYSHNPSGHILLKKCWRNGEGEYGSSKWRRIALCLLAKICFELSILFSVLSSSLELPKYGSVNWKTSVNLDAAVDKIWQLCLLSFRVFLFQTTFLKSEHSE